MPTASGIAKAAAAEIVGGGPEDPVADVVAAKALSGSKKPKAEASPQESKPSAKAPLKSSGKQGTVKKFSNKIVGRNLLLMELIICLVILIFGTIVAPSGSNDGVTRLMVKGSGLLAVFFILSIVSAGGKGPQKIASSLGILVTLSYVLTSSDMHDIFKWISSFFGKPKSAKSSEEVSSGSTPEGTLNADGTYTSTNGYTY